MTNEEIKRLVDEVKEEVVGWRRHLHAHPELSFQEEKNRPIRLRKASIFRQS